MTLAAWALGEGGPLPFALVVVAEVLFSLAVLRPVRTILAGVEAPGAGSRAARRRFARFEREAFSAPTAAAHASIGFRTAGVLPSRRIAQLRRLIDLLNSRRNQLFAPAAAFLLWGAQVAFAIERWRRAIGPAPGRMAATASASSRRSARLAGYAYEHPGRSVSRARRTAGACFEGGRLAHPLLPACARGSATTCTWAAPRGCCSSAARTCRARARCCGRSASTPCWRWRARRCAPSGCASRRWRSAPRCACRTRCRPGNRGSTPRSPGCARSSALAAGRLPLLFLLDEMLHGTNSHDREHGAEAIVRGLARPRRHRPGDDARSRACRGSPTASRRAPRTCTSTTCSRRERWRSTTGCGRASCRPATRWR